MQYLPVAITPDPRKESWPRDGLVSFGCEVEIQISFAHYGRDVLLDLRLNDRLQPDRIPVYIGDDTGKHLWNPQSNVHIYFLFSLINLK